MAEKIAKPIGMVAKPTRPQEFYDSVKRKFAEERDLRLSYRPEGTAQNTSDLSGELWRLFSAADLGAAARAWRREYPDRRARRGRRRHVVLESIPRCRMRRR